MMRMKEYGVAKGAAINSHAGRWSTDYHRLFTAKHKGFIIHSILVTCALIGCLFFTSPSQAQVINCAVSPYGVVLHYEGPLPSGEIQVSKDGKSFASLKLRSSEKEISTALKKA